MTDPREETATICHECFDDDGNQIPHASLHKSLHHLVSLAKELEAERDSFKADAAHREMEVFSLKKKADASGDTEFRGAVSEPTKSYSIQKRGEAMSWRVNINLIMSRIKLAWRVLFDNELLLWLEATLSYTRRHAQQCRGDGASDVVMFDTRYRDLIRGLTAVAVSREAKADIRKLWEAPT